MKLIRTLTSRSSEFRLLAINRVAVEKLSFLEGMYGSLGLG